MENQTFFDTSWLVEARQGSEKAYGSILRFFYPVIKGICGSYFLIGGDREDLFQEGLIGLYGAVQSYDAARHEDFVKYAKICIHRAMINAIRSDRRKKHQPLNGSVPLEETLCDRGNDPEQIVLQQERYVEVYDRMMEALSPLERQVLTLWLEGLDTAQIAARCGKSVKSVGNALTRVRGKIR